MIYSFLANGFEEIEALAVVDILRRCDLDVITVGVGGKTVFGAHNIEVFADVEDKDLDFSDKFDAVILPGGMPGSANLENSAIVQKAIDKASSEGLLCAICAAPFVLGHKGLLNGKNAVCYPGFEGELKGAKILNNPVVKDGNIITAKGPGAALDFAFAIAEEFVGSEKVCNIRKSMQCNQ